MLLIYLNKIYILCVGYVVLGSTGEFPFLSKDEKVKLVKFVKDASSSDKLIIAGSGCECKYSSFQVNYKLLNKT